MRRCPLSRREPSLGFGYGRMHRSVDARWAGHTGSRDPALTRTIASSRPAPTGPCRPRFLLRAASGSAAIPAAGRVGHQALPCPRHCVQLSLQPRCFRAHIVQLLPRQVKLQLLRRDLRAQCSELFRSGGLGLLWRSVKLQPLVLKCGVQQ